MTDTSHQPALETLVAAAQRGEAEAFAQLVARFQRFALGYAYGRLGDRDLAQDAVQEAFVAAFLGIGQLRQPQAFPGWLRRVIHKHCDRLSRGQRPVHLEDATAQALSGDAPGPAEQLAAAHEQQWLRRAIEGLPETERLPLALHYLVGLPQSEIAGLLELPLTTIKKRLYSARERLKREKELDMSLESATSLLEPRDLPERVALFLAIRLGDVRQVGELLDRTPDLLEAEERFSREDALAAGLPLAHKVTPLILAAGLGQLPIVELLLARGADPEGRCGCVNDESALWAAVESGRQAVVERLLAAGANPESQNQAGLRPLHLAARRGDQALVELLLAHGAEREATDHAGRTAADWARAHGYGHPVGLAGRQPGDVIWSGIKALDLAGPLPRQGLVRCHGGAHVGRNVFLAELSQRLVARGLSLSWIGFADVPAELAEMENLLAEIGLGGEVAMLSGLEALDGCLAEARPESARLVFEEDGRLADVEARYAAFAQAPGLTILIESWRRVERGQGTRAPERIQAPFAGHLVFDATLASRGYWPALDPTRSQTRVDSGDPAQARLAERARQLLTRLRHRPESLRAEDVSRAARLEAFLTQPFVVAEPGTGRLGTDVSPADLFRGVETILAGGTDEVPAAELRFGGALPPRA